jgi:transposase
MIRHRLVQMRTRITNQLHALRMNENRCLKGKLWNERGRAELEKLPLALWASRRREELLDQCASRLALLSRKTGKGDKCLA